MDAKEYLRIKDLAERARRKADKLVGKRDQLLEELRRDYGCKSLDKGEALAQQLDQEAKQAEAEAESLLTEFKKQYGESLEDV